MSMVDVAIVGGSYAGLSAALQLGRARRNVLILDAGQRRNRFAHSAHGFLGSDGESPAAIAEKGRANVLAYASVTLEQAEVTELGRIDGGFRVRAGGREFASQRILLATGVTDELPAIDGLRERWGQSVFHCPYCHGYELDRGPIGVLASHPMSAHQAALVSEWSTPGQTTLFLNDVLEPSDHDRALLAERGVAIERTPVAAVRGETPRLEIQLRDGRKVEVAGLFTAPRTRVPIAFAEQLGCTLEQGPTGPYFKTNAMKQTNVPGVFAAGDAALAMSTVAISVADGAMAAAAVHRSLVFGMADWPVN